MIIYHKVLFMVARSSLWEGFLFQIVSLFLSSMHGPTGRYHNPHWANQWCLLHPQLFPHKARARYVVYLLICLFIVYLYKSICLFVYFYGSIYVFIFWFIYFICLYISVYLIIYLNYWFIYWFVCLKVFIFVKTVHDVDWIKYAYMQVNWENVAEY